MSRATAISLRQIYVEMSRTSRVSQLEKARTGKPRCVMCGSFEAKSKCGRCHSTTYCSKKCQTIDWPKHRGSCREGCREDNDRREAESLQWMTRMMTDWHLGKPPTIPELLKFLEKSQEDNAKQRSSTRGKQAQDARRVAVEAATKIFTDYSEDQFQAFLHQDYLMEGNSEAHKQIVQMTREIRNNPQKPSAGS